MHAQGRLHAGHAVAGTESTRLIAPVLPAVPSRSCRELDGALQQKSLCSSDLLTRCARVKAGLVAVLPPGKDGAQLQGPDGVAIHVECHEDSPRETVTGAGSPGKASLEGQLGSALASLQGIQEAVAAHAWLLADELGSAKADVSQLQQAVSEACRISAQQEAQAGSQLQVQVLRCEALQQENHELTGAPPCDTSCSWPMHGPATAELGRAAWSHPHACTCTRMGIRGVAQPPASNGAHVQRSQGRLCRPSTSVPHPVGSLAPLRHVPIPSATSSCLHAGMNADLQARLDSLQQQVAAAQQRCSSSQAQLAAQATEIRGAGGRALDAEAEARSLHVALATAQAELDVATQGVAALRDQASRAPPGP